ncbi:hypothetical protein C0Q70_19986 [Pomacea canaliculata]|uniref:GH10 domain-containing protein n=1 Tax=Pomacea canaliculata TaxID=400727 RepID=A0A2T7NEA1_POMCA|nr:hypothetical protein C0Q70_19986 [Pomacea canaliculata]
MKTIVVFVLLIMLETGLGQNLLDNPSFEGDLTGTWENNGFLMERVSVDKVDGNFALKASYRDRSLEGPLQVLYGLKTGARYELSVFVKVLNDLSGTLWQNIKVTMQYEFVNPTEIGYYVIANRGLCNTSMGWIKINGSMNAPERAFNWARLAIRGPDPGVDFLVDNAALYEVPENTNWLADSYTNIDTYRKSNVNINFTLPSGVSSSQFDVQTNPDFSNAVNAANVLVSSGLKVRGHNIIWDVADNIPDAVKALSGQELRDEVDKHVQYMCNLGLGKLAHWDVMNEMTHGLYYEEKLEDRNFTKNLFRQMKTCDNVTKLFFNDYQAVDIGGSTEEYYQMMLEYLNENVPVEGLGVQGHFQEYLAVDPTLILKRVDRLATLGIDVVMTEFDVQSPDHVQRADWIEDAMRAMFSHPAMKGIVYWSFWDQDTQNVNRELIQGTNVTIIEPGQRFFCLIKKEWTTNLTRNLGSDLNVFFRGFRGDYQVIIKRSGVPIQVESFSLGSSDMTVNIKVANKTTAANVPEDKDYVPRCVSHRGQKPLGLQSTSSTNMQLTCVNVESTPSGGNEDDVASVTCGTDRVMTGCTSYQNAMLWTRKGEQVTIENGVAVCKAYNGRNSSAGVTAAARCCKVSGLSCEFRVAGPSLTFGGAQAEALCSTNTLLIGCSSYSKYPDMNGAYANDTANSCVAEGGNPVSTNPAERSGSVAYSACCSCPDMSCTHVSSLPTTLGAGDYQGVTCPFNTSMVSCNYFAPNGRSGGARIVETNGVEECRAYMGDNLSAGSRGVIATATCCM